MGHTLQIVQRTGRHHAEIHQLRRTAAQNGGHLVEHLLLGRDLALLGQIPCRAERLPSRNNRYLDQRIRMFEHPAHGRMSRLVVGNRLLLLRRNNLVLTLQTTDNTVDRIEEVVLLDLTLVAPRGDQGRLVADIGDIGSRETRRLLGQKVAVEIRIELQILQVHVEYLAPLLQIGQLDVDLTVEAPGAQQRLVEYVGPVRRGQHVTPAFVPKPSISVSNWFSVFSRSSFDENPAFLLLARPIASISSMKTMQGAFSLA